ncbi:hypothetical protein LCGC14_0665370 [marine sediment metagenome]|uniref:Uncharacterized protein n=1 Tax=marine sediment metagenome TaxID=412755 RepID=A0A0F9TDV7_9ZZZZ
MLLSIEGDEAVGKTTLAYSGPLPLVGFAFDMGAERAMMGGRFNELFNGVDIHYVPYDTQPVLQGRMEGETGLWIGHDITVFELPPPVQLDSIRVKGYVTLWTYFIAMAAKAFMANEVKTLVFDTMTVARRVKADAYLESLQNAAFDAAGKRIMVQGVEMKMRERLLQKEYGNTNDAIRDIYTTGAGVGKNLIAVHHLTDEYASRPNAKGEIEDVATGRRILEGLKNTHRFVDIAILMTKDRGTVKCEFKKFGYSLPIEGTFQDNPTWDGIADRVALATGDRIQLDLRKANG